VEDYHGAFGIVARFGRSAPANEAAFDDLVEALTAMMLRLMGA
jgi:hypothetical protein